MNYKLSDIVRDIVAEEWDKDVEIKSTGEHADKTITQIKKEMEALKGKKPFNREQFSELMFALRAKQGWKKGKGATGTTEQINTMNKSELKELVREEVSKAKMKKEYQHIKDAYYKTGVALENITNNDINIEILSLELREALDSIDLILGKTTPDDIINNIFSHMCVGK